MYYTDWADIPANQYQLVLADPPWPFKDQMKGHSFSLDHEYQTQPLEWIKALPVRNITTKDSALLLWVVSPQLDDGIDVLKAWGFKYVTVAFVWSKLTSKGKKVSNLGRWTMGNVELCLLGRKGKIGRACKNVKQLIEAERTAHSHKPDELRARAATLFGDVSRIELFARGASDGWDQFGDTPTYP
jgi:N6-adenosine-specific RNA methylase IME4